MTSGQSELLKGIPPREADRVLSLGKRLTLTSGAELFHMGAPADSLYLVSRGRIKLTLPMQIRGNQQDSRRNRRMVGADSAAPVYAHGHGALADGGHRLFPRDPPGALRRVSRHRLCHLIEPGGRGRTTPAAFPGHVAARNGAHGGIALRLSRGIAP